MQAFREYADSENICIDKELSILSNDDDDEYDRLLTRLLEEPKTRVIVCFCEGETVNAILKAVVAIVMVAVVVLWLQRQLPQR